MPAANRVALLVADEKAVGHLKRNNQGFVPMRRGEVSTIHDVASLPATASMRALRYGEWRPLEVELQWSDEISGWTAYAWEIRPLPD